MVKKRVSAGSKGLCGERLRASGRGAGGVLCVLARRKMQTKNLKMSLNCRVC